MASKRALQFLARRAPATLSTRPSTRPVPIQTQRAPQPPRLAPAPALALLRYNSTSTFPSTSKSKPYTYADVLALIEAPTTPATPLLIDVREPDEYKANSIPTALNIPITSQPDALMLGADEFEERFGWQKPPLQKEVVFFCKAGVRSSAAAQLAKMAGYENVGEYRGSWLDWEKNGGPTMKDPK